jgi:hypothetical protein
LYDYLDIIVTVYTYNSYNTGMGRAEVSIWCSITIRSTQNKTNQGLLGQIRTLFGGHIESEGKMEITGRDIFIKNR